MHFEILVEDQSGKRMLDVLVPRIIAPEDNFTIHAYKGIGRIPPGLRGQIDASKRILLDRLPALLRGYGKAFNFPAAVRRAYPKAREQVLRDYQNDAICGTWETLAEAVYPGGLAKLKDQGSQAAGAEKSRWAEAIAPYIDPERNQSPSFQYFRAKLRELAGC